MTEIADIDLQTLLRTGSFSGLLEQIDQDGVTKEPRSTIASRKEALSQALATLDETKLLEMQETLSNYVDLLASSEVSFDGHGSELDSTQLLHLMRRHLDTKQIKELVETVNEGLKRIIFEAITAKIARERPDEPFPEYVPGDIEVPALGKRFCRDGAGRKTPHLDHKELRRQLGEALWAKVTVTEDIPASKSTHLSEVLLMAEATKDPAVLQKIKAALSPGGWNIGSYTVRDIKAKK